MAEGKTITIIQKGKKEIAKTLQVSVGITLNSCNGGNFRGGVDVSAFRDFVSDSITVKVAATLYFEYSDRAGDSWTTDKYPTYVDFELILNNGVETQTDEQKYLFDTVSPPYALARLTSKSSMVITPINGYTITNKVSTTPVRCWQIP